MAAHTVYLFISIAAVLIVAISILKNIYFRRTGILLFGQNYKPGTPEYKRLKKIFSNRNLTINVVLLPIFIINLAFVVYTIAHLPYQGYAPVAFTLGVLFVIAILVGLTRAKQIKHSVERNIKNKPWIS